MASVVDEDDTEIEIKHEAMDYYNRTSTPPPDYQYDLCLETVSNTPRHVEHDSSVKAEEQDLNELYIEGECETRSTHYLPTLRTAQNVRTDPVNTDPDHHPPQQSSSVQIKSEVDENTHKVECSEEELSLNAESDPDYEPEPEPERENDPDYTPSASSHLTRKVRRRRVTNRSYKAGIGSDSKSSKAKNGKLLSAQHNKRSEHKNRFSPRRHLTKNRRIHTGEKPYKCDVCEKNFGKPCDMTIHMRVHTGEKPFHCDVCGKNFSRKNHLTEHKRCHTGEKPYECQVCKKNFAKSYNLTVHSRSHTGEKPYACDMCTKWFASSSELTVHKRIHTQEKPFKCDVCEKSFSQKGNLTVHKRGHNAHL